MKLPIDAKSMCSVFIVLIVMVSLCSVIIVDELNDDDSSTNTEGSYQILARANTDGSGIYIKESVLTERGGASAFYTDNGDGTYSISTANKEAWGGLIVGTPGAATIQHVQMQQIAEAAGLSFTLYQVGQSIDKNHMYYVATMSNATTVLGYTGTLDAGILWEPQYSKIVADSKFTELALTNNLFAGHTCCLLVGLESYITSHTDVTERFLAAYVKAVLWVNEALSGDSAKYDKLLEICRDVTSGTIDDSTLSQALTNINYVYADADGTLNGLRKDVADLASSLISMGLLSHNLKDLGYNYSSQFANDFVDEGYLMSALDRLSIDDPSKEDPTLSSGSKANITVACISGDIHQVAIHVAKALGFFSAYNLNVTTSAATNGPGVAVAIQNGTAQFGVVGAPPATSTAINSMLIQA